MNRSKTGVALLATLSALAAPSAAQADLRVCQPKVEWHAIDPNGFVIVSLEGMGVARFCDVNSATATSVGEIKPETCRGWYASFMSVRARQTKVTMWLNFPGAAPECSSIHFNWAVPDPYPYFMAFD